MKGLPLPLDAGRALVKFARGGLHPPEVTPVVLTPLQQFLRQWQSDRLAATHADLLSNSEYSRAAHFLLTDLYAPRDFSRRDAELVALYRFLRPLLPPPALKSMADLVALNDLTNELDGALILALTAGGVTDSFTTEQYETAYRQGDYGARVRQIELVVSLLREVAWLHQLPLIRTTLHASGGTARRLGWGDLHDFLLRGYDVWSQVHDSEPFIYAVESRETAILNRIFDLPATADRPTPL